MSVSFIERDCNVAKTLTCRRRRNSNFLDRSVYKQMREHNSDKANIVKQLQITAILKARQKFGPPIRKILGQERSFRVDRPCS